MSLFLGWLNLQSSRGRRRLAFALLSDSVLGRGLSGLPHFASVLRQRSSIAWPLLFHFAASPAVQKLEFLNNRLVALSC